MKTIKRLAVLALVFVLVLPVFAGGSKEKATTEDGRPIITMWAPLLSLTLRLFGNALSGFSIMALVYAALEALSSDIFRPIFGITGGGISGADIIIAPIITPVLHLYFDLFSSFIQTLVFSMLTMIFISQEQVEDESSDVLKSIETVQN